MTEEREWVDNMNYRIIFALLLMAIMITGCTGQKTGTSKETTETNTEKTTDAVNSLIGKGWQELVALNVPMECNVIYKGKAKTEEITSAVLYMKGDKFKEVVTMDAEGVKLGITIISKNDGNIYMLYDNPAMMTAMTQGKIKCDGIIYPIDVNQSATVDTSVLQSSEYVDLDCKPAIFGDEMFSTPGKLCTLKEITKAVMGDQDLCGSITDPEQKKDCEDALG